MKHTKKRTTEKKISDFLSSHNRRLRKMGFLNESLPSVEDVKNHLKTQLKGKKLCSWSNYGKIWQIDHVIPFNSVKTQQDAHMVSQLNNFEVRYLEVNQNHQLTTKEHKTAGDLQYEKKFINKLKKEFVDSGFYKKLDFDDFVKISCKAIKKL